MLPTNNATAATTVACKYSSSPSTRILNVFGWAAWMVSFDMGYSDSQANNTTSPHPDYIQSLQAQYLYGFYYVIDMHLLTQPPQTPTTPFPPGGHSCEHRHFAFSAQQQQHNRHPPQRPHANVSIFYVRKHNIHVGKRRVARCAVIMKKSAWL